MPNLTSSFTIDYDTIDIKNEDITDGKVHIDEFFGDKRLWWDGEGLFDILMHSCDENLRVQYDNGKFTKDTYANAYVEIMKAVLAAVPNILIARAELKLKALQMKEQIVKLKLDSELVKAQIKLTDRQRMAFDDNMLIKLVQSQLDAFSMIYSSGMLDDYTLPDPINYNELADCYETFKTKALAGKTYHIDDRVVQPESDIIM